MPKPSAGEPSMAQPSTTRPSTTLRGSLRRARRRLSTTAQRDAAQSLQAIISRQLFYRRSSHISFYLPTDGEIDPTPLCRLSAQLGKRCYLPIVSGDGTLVFQHYMPNRTVLRRNAFGILEPRPHPKHAIATRMLDVVFLPLVGFDSHGNRMGMGKGFYDRCFQGIGSWWHKPLLIGLAHSSQHTELQPQPWDVPLHGVATERQLHRFGRERLDGARRAGTDGGAPVI